MLTAESLRHAANEVARASASGAEVDLAARIVAEVLLDQARHRSPAVAPSVVDEQLQAAGVGASLAPLPAGKPLELLRSGARTTEERATLAALLARHLENVLARRDGAATLRAALPLLDWLELDGRYPPYTAARYALPADVTARFDELVRSAPVEAPTQLAAAALRVLRGHAPEASMAPMTPSAGAPPNALEPPRASRNAPMTLACEVDGAHRALPLRLLAVVTGWGLVRGAVLAFLRLVFRLRSPATLTLDGDALRVVGHTELLGRTLRTWDALFPVDRLTELHRETRFPMLPAALSVLALTTGSIFGARYVVQGAREVYFPVIALGLGYLAGGVLFDFVVHALYPGVEGKVRLTVRSGSRALVLSHLHPEQVERLLVAVEARYGSARKVLGEPPSAPPTAPSTAPAPVHDAQP
ncbi:MAG: hypothetical protein HY909_17930 [Deltaproteobacteria bacterium]|nr:hypothetical protein [Deltaproteobacteria bacterium]